jgi:hypothetical protein
VSCFNFIPPSARERFFSDEAKAEKLSWFPPKLLITDRQEKRMRRLAASDKVSDRIVAAGNPSTPREVLWRLLFDEEPKVRGWVARNPITDWYLLSKLTEDEDPGIAAYATFRLGWEVTGEEDHATGETDADPGTS